MKRMNEHAFWILCALAQGEAHGYGLALRATELNGRERMGPGALYGTLERLCHDGLIEPTRDEIVDGRNRRYYRLTEGGRVAVTAETERRRNDVRRAATALGLA